MARRKFETVLKNFIKKIELEDKIIEADKQRILEEATCWNKEEVMKELIKRVKEYREYEDFSDEESDFPYKLYEEKFMQEMPKTVNEEKDYSWMTDMPNGED